MPNSENLKPFKKGYDSRRNGNGRKRKTPELDVILDDILSEKKNGVSVIEAVVKSLLKEILKKGNVRAAEVILNRFYGKVEDKVDHTTKGDKIMNILVNSENTKKNINEAINKINRI